MLRNWLEGATVKLAWQPLTLASRTIFASVEPLRAPAGLNLQAASLVLTHKRNVPWLKSHPKSATAMIVSAPPAERSAWLSACDLQADTDAPFKGGTIVAEDAAPDTCLSLVTLARLHAGLDVPIEWTDYADRWESGDTSTTGAPFESWGALHSALVHPLFSKADLAGQDAQLAQALMLGCSFVDGLIEARVDPAQIDASTLTDPDLIAKIERASAYLRLEQMIAEHVAETGDVIQLALEIEGGSRRRLVDAAILTEVQSFTGALKVFLRNTQASPSGEGYAFLALHRPEYADTGNDITFSVDPKVNVSLRDVWEGLELAEWAAWNSAGEERPSDAPRNLKSFSRPNPDCDRELPAGIRPCNQPWYDGGPLYSLIAAPRYLDQQAGIRGSKLSWDDALAVLWAKSAPSRLFDFTQLDDPAKRVDLAGRPDIEHRRRLVADGDLWLLKLAPGANAQRASMFWNHTVSRTIAAYVAEGRSEILRLPGTDEFDVVRGRGGLIEVTPHGAAIVRLSADPTFPTLELERVIEEAAKLQHRAKSLEAKIDEARKKSVAAISSGSTKKADKAIAAVYAVLEEALSLEAPFPVRSLDPLVASVQEKLEQRWNAQRRFSSVIEQTTHLREMVVAANAIRTNGIVNGIATFGFPFVLLANFFTFAASGENSAVRGLEWNGIEFMAIFAWLASGALLALLLYLGLRWRNFFWRGDVKAARQAKVDTSTKMR